MTDWYNTSFLDNSSGLVMLFEGPAQEPWFAGAILLFTFLLFMVYFRSSGFQDSFLASSFIITLMSGGFIFLGWATSSLVIIPIGLLIIALIMKVWGEG